MSEKIKIDVDVIRRHFESLSPSTSYSDIDRLFSDTNVSSLHEYWDARRKEIAKNMPYYYVANSSYNLHTAENLPAYIDHIEKYEYLLKRVMFFSDNDTRKILRKLRACEYQKILIYDAGNKHGHFSTNYDFISWLIFLDYCVLFSGNSTDDLTVDESPSGHHLSKLDYLLGCLCAIESVDLSKDYSFEDLCYIVYYLLAQFGLYDYGYYVERYISEHNSKEL